MYKEKEVDLLLSVIIGDGCISKIQNSYSLYIGHGESQKDYLKWKANLLSDEIFHSELKIQTIKVFLKETQKSYIQYRICKTSKNLAELYDIYHNTSNTRMIDILRHIKSDRSIAIWFMDDGSVFKRKRKHKDGSIYFNPPTLKLCTHCFTEEENLQIIKWFKNRYLIDAKIVSETKRGKKYYYIRFNSKDSYKIFQFSKKYIDLIPSMKKKFAFFYEYYKC